MSKRIKFSDRKQAKKQEENYERENTKRKEVPDIIIACEDSVSSPTYFRQIVKDLIRNKTITQDSFVIPPHDGRTHPSGVLLTLKEYISEGDKKYSDFKHKWIVIDRDIERVNGGGHTQEDYNKAIEQSKNEEERLRVEVAYANDCFELWYLLHFNYVCTPISRDQIVVDLITKLKDLDAKTFSKLNKKSIKDKSSTEEIFKAIKDKQPDAIKNAENLFLSHGTVYDPENKNPCTTVHKLVKILNTF